MKEKLTSIIAASLLAFSPFLATAQEKPRTENPKAETAGFSVLNSFYGRKIVKYPKYTVELINERDSNCSTRHSELVIRDKDSIAKVFDKYPYGLGENGDYATGHHTFRNGDVLYVELKCEKNNNYTMKSRLSENGKCISKGHFSTSNIWFTIFRPFVEFINAGKIRILKDWSTLIYGNLVKSAIEETEPREMPYSLFIETFEKLEKQLPEIGKRHQDKDEKITIGSAMYELSDDFINAGNKRLKEIKAESKKRLVPSSK